MKKWICFALVLLLCMTLLLPAMAAENFVPSIEYKDGPEIEDAVMDGEDMAQCLVVTSILKAREKSTDIYQQDRDILLGVYDALCDGGMKLPLEESYVIRELVDVSFRKTPCIQGEHAHKEKLAEEKVTLSVKFDLGIKKDDKLFVLVYIDGKWVAIDYSRSRAWINLKAEGISGGKSHDIEIVVKDGCGNSAKWQGKIVR